MVLSRPGFALLVALAPCLLGVGCGDRDADSEDPGAAYEIDADDPTPRTDAATSQDTGPEDDAAIRALVSSYFRSLKYPDPPKFDQENIAHDVIGAWSDGKVHKGRDAFLRAHAKGVEEVAANFKSFSAEAESQVVRPLGKMAWVFCRSSLTGVLKDGKTTFQRKIDSTFVLEKRDGRWRLVHELSRRAKE